MLHAFVYRSRFLLLLLHLRLCKKQFFFWGKQKFVFRLSFKMNWCRLQVMSLVFIDIRESSLEHILVVVKSQVTNPPNTSLTHPNQTFQILLFPPFDIFPCTNVFISEGIFFCSFGCDHTLIWIFSSQTSAIMQKKLAWDSMEHIAKLLCHRCR